MENAYKRLRIFIGCPSDVTTERGIVKKSIGSLQKYANEHGCFLEVVDFRDVAPAAGRPEQAIINQLPPHTWDIFVGILWHKFGTPPGGSQAFSGVELESGTEEEFRLAYNCWVKTRKPWVMFYRCVKNVDLRMIDIDQYQKVDGFFKEISKADSENSIFIKQFDDDSVADQRSFEEILREDLMHVIGQLAKVNHVEVDEKAIGNENFISNLPQRADFFGRKIELDKVRKAISRESKEWGILIDAIGGMGKTSLALEAANRALDDGLFKACVFVTAKQKSLDSTGVIVDEDPDAIAVDDFINETARRLGQQSIAQMDRKEKKQALFAFVRDLPTLFIYDNLETLDEGQQTSITRFLKELPPNCKAILTSRRKGAGSGVHLLLNELDWDAAEKIIEKERNKDDDLIERLGNNIDAWKSLHKETHGSPLALMHILGLMRMRESLNIKNAIKLLQTKVGIEERIEFMFGEAREELDENDKSAMYALSFFISAGTDAWAEVAMVEAAELTRAIDNLGKLCLLDSTQKFDRYTLHPLTKEFAQKELKHNTQIAYKTALKYIKYWLEYSSKFGGSKGNYLTYSFLEEEWPNIEAATELLCAVASTDNNLGRMLNEFSSSLSHFLLDSGRWEERIKISEHSYTVAISLQANCLAGWDAYNMAFVSLNRDNVKDAENWISKALSAWAKESGGHEKATGFIIRGNLAEYCKDYELSEQYYLDALGIYKELESEENISKVLNWLGNSALFQGQHDKAEQYYIEAKQKTKELSNLACYNYNLGNLELSRENWEAAKTWLQESLQMAIEADLQEVIASSYLGLARVREEECSYAKAITNVENAARIFERLKHRELKKAKNLIFRLKQKISPSSD